MTLDSHSFDGLTCVKATQNISRKIISNNQRDRDLFRLVISIFRLAEGDFKPKKPKRDSLVTHMLPVALFQGGAPVIVSSLDFCLIFEPKN